MFSIVIDQREHELIVMIPNLIEQYNLPIQTTVKALDIGDIEIHKNDELYYIIERKSLNDLASSITDGRYKEQSLRLQETCSLPATRKIYVIEGDIYTYGNQTHRYKKKPYSKKSVSRSILYGCITSIIHGKQFRVMRTAHIQDTAETIVRFVDKIRRYDHENKIEGIQPVSITPSSDQDTSSTQYIDYSSVIHKVKHKNITKHNIGVICLSQIPYISNTIAQTILEKYGDLYTCIHQLRTNPDEFKTIKVNGRKLSSRVLHNLFHYLADDVNTNAIAIKQGEVHLTVDTTNTNTNSHDEVVDDENIDKVA